MNDLDYLRTNFTGRYVSQMTRQNVLTCMRHDPGYSNDARRSIAMGLMTLDFSMSPNFEFQLLNKNGSTIRFYIDTVRNGFWFTEFDFQSIAIYENYTLTIEVTRSVSTERKITYQFYQEDHGPEGISKGIKFKMFYGITSWTMTYKKIS